MDKLVKSARIPTGKMSIKMNIEDVVVEFPLNLKSLNLSPCERCRYEQPMWYPEEVQKVLKNVFVRIGQVYYG